MSRWTRIKSWPNMCILSSSTGSEQRIFVTFHKLFKLFSWFHYLAKRFLTLFRLYELVQKFTCKRGYRTAKVTSLCQVEDCNKDELGKETKTTNYCDLRRFLWFIWMCWNYCSLIIIFVAPECSKWPTLAEFILATNYLTLNVLEDDLSISDD